MVNDSPFPSVLLNGSNLFTERIRNAGAKVIYVTGIRPAQDVRIFKTIKRA